MADPEERTAIDRTEEYRITHNGDGLPDTRYLVGYHNGKEAEFPNPCHPENTDVKITMVPKMVNGQIIFNEAKTLYTGQHYINMKYCSSNDIGFKNQGRNDLDWK